MDVSGISIAVRWLGYPGVAISRHLGIGPPAVSRAAERGATILAANVELKKELERTIKQ